MRSLRPDARQLGRLQELTDAALGHLELEELLGALLERTKSLLDVDTCAFLLLDEEKNELVARAAVGIEEEVERGMRIPLGKGFAGRVAAERRPVVIRDVDHSDVLSPLLQEKGIKSMVGVPLLVHGAVVGVLHVGSLVDRDFTPNELELLQLAGDRAAIAIEHARVFEAERSARDKLERVQAITDVALAHMELEELLQVLLPRIRAILGTDTCAVLLLDEERKELVARAALGIEEEVEQGVRIPFGAGFAGRIAASGKPVILSNVAEADVVNPILREKGITSMLGVPLLVQGRATGVLHVGTLTPRHFTQDDEELLLLVADRVAIAIERTRLHEELILLDELRANFVAIASHELRTPAASVYGAVATLYERRDSLPAETREEVLRIAYEQGERLARLLDQLLDLSRLDAEAIDIIPERVNVREHVEEIVSTAVADPASVRIEVAEDTVAIVDRNALDRIVTNLLTNAFRYGTPPVHVRAEQTDRHFRLVVEDEGAGVAPEFVPDLFERFTRSEASRASAIGTGLGLAIARSYARAHGGDLVYEDAEPHGARFRLVLPSRTA